MITDGFKLLINPQPQQNELNQINFATSTPQVKNNIPIHYNQISMRQTTLVASKETFPVSSGILRNSSTAAITKGHVSTKNSHFLNI